ncbi:MAG: flagellar hook-basal body complex protein FliE [Armatimonadetes bacterium]|nr:flagellar hook-basal body complex protein FliE [Armatimonadota bacterium]
MRIDNSQIAALTQSSQPPVATPTTVEEPSEDFGQMLMDALKEVNHTQVESQRMQNDLMAGRPVEFHDVMIAMEKASTAMQLTLQVRNKVLEAYQEISRMNV